MTAVKNVTAGNALIPHPIADACPGEMTTEEYNALKLDLQRNGQQQKITLYEGKILDGRARYKALNELGKQARTEVFKGTAAEAKQFVLSTNLQRRTLTSMQKAIVAARLHREEGGPTQQDAAAMVGCSVQSVNIAVRLLAKNNTPLIKRAERGDATRGEIEELLYESKDIQRGANAPVAAKEPDEVSDEEMEELLGGEKPKGKRGADIIKLEDHRPMPTKGAKPSRAGKVAHETPASRVVQAFKGLTEAERKSFVDMAWTWLEPAIRAAGRSIIPEVKTDAKKAKAAQAKHAAEDKAEAQAKATKAASKKRKTA